MTPSRTALPRVILFVILGLAPAIGSAQIPMPRLDPVPAPATSGPAQLGSAGGEDPYEKLPPPEISPEAAAVFDAMDKKHSQSKSRSAELVGRIVLSSTAWQSQRVFGLNMSIEFPNRLAVLGYINMQRGEPTSATDQRKDEGRWWLVSDGKTMKISRGVVVSQRSPATLDNLPAQQIEIEGWGENALINSFLRTKPSTAFRTGLKRARLLERTTSTILLELVMAAPRFVIQTQEIPAEFDLLYHLQIDGPSLIPKRMHADMIGLSREIYKRTRPGETVQVKEAFVELVVRSVDMTAEFADRRIFEIPLDPPTTGTAPLLSGAPRAR